MHLQWLQFAKAFQRVRAFPGLGHELVQTYGVAPASLRHKLWRLHSHLVAEDCHAAGIEFVPAPPGAQDGRGYLAEAAYGDDSTHCNTWYGRRVIEQIVRRHRPGFALAEAAPEAIA